MQVLEETKTNGGVVAADAPPPAEIRRLRVLLIRPSKYDDDGYVMRFLRGVLPSNTLAALAALTEDVAASGALGPVRIETEMLDETVQRIDAARLARRFVRRGTRAVAALCGVQTNQFPRAADLANQLHAAGFTVMMGGFHVSGAIAMSERGMPPELQALLDAGVTLVKGEVEDCWGDLLRDALHGRLQPFYDITTPPDLRRARIPSFDPKLMKRFTYPNMSTIDAGRGCPFNCHFCTIVNVQGRTMRCRDAEAITRHIREGWARKIDWYFFTDDNFARNPEWEAIFDGLIALRRDEGIAIQFMMQVDVQAWRIKNFMTKAADAGCTQVFIGMETINPANIEAAGKRQNRVEDYARMIEVWHEHGIACHVGYIIGFPHDTVAGVREDVRRLRDEIKVDQASFFMLVPLPGSRDHQELTRQGAWMDPDYNRFDSFHAATRHPRMTEAEWFGVYREAWREFYTVKAMQAILNRANNDTYWGLFKNFLWYKYAALIEGTHPMIVGFFRLKERRERRPGWPIEPFWRYYRQRAGELARWTREVARLYFEMQEVWLATRGRAQIQANWDQFRGHYEKMRARMGERLADAQAGAREAWQRAGQAGRERAETLARQFGEWRQDQTQRVRGWRRVLGRLNPLAIRYRTRRPLDRYWRETLDKLRAGRVLSINPLALAVNLWRDAKLMLLFNLHLLAGYGK